jgi:hypothetical protein
MRYIIDIETSSHRPAQATASAPLKPTSATRNQSPPSSHVERSAPFFLGDSGLDVQ